MPIVVFQPSGMNIFLILLIFFKSFFVDEKKLNSLVAQHRSINSTYACKLGGKNEKNKKNHGGDQNSQNDTFKGTHLLEIKYFWSVVDMEPPCIKLFVNKFRCWNRLALRFRLGAVTMIKGENGCGKTTLMFAMAWCLYGGNMSVAPDADPHADSNVHLVFPNMSVYRQRSPKRLSVIKDNIQYEDDVAQSIINDIFGIEDTWYASCYIKQRRDNIFLTSTNAEKLNILQSITFSDENPIEEVAKVDQVIRAEEPMINSLIHTYHRDLATYQYNAQGVDTSRALTGEQIAQLHEKILAEETQLLEYDKIRTSRLAALQVMSTYQNQEKQINDQLAVARRPLPNCPVSLPDNMTIAQTIVLYNNIGPQLHQLNQTRLQLANLPSLSVDTTWTVSDYEAAIIAESVYGQQIKLLAGWQLTPDPVVIQSHIKHWRTVLDRQAEYQATNKQLGAMQAQILVETTLLREINNLYDTTTQQLNKINDTCLLEEKNKTDASTRADTLHNNLKKQEAYVEQCKQYLITLQQMPPATLPTITRSAPPPSPSPPTIPSPPIMNALPVAPVEPSPPLAPTGFVPRTIAPPTYVEIDQQISTIKEREEQERTHVQQAVDILSALQRSRDILSCPHCQGSLRYQQNHLIVAEGSVVKLEDITAQEAAIKRARDKLSVTQQELVQVNKQRQDMMGQYQYLLQQEATRERDHSILVRDYEIKANQIKQAHNANLVAYERHCAQMVATHQNNLSAYDRNVTRLNQEYQQAQMNQQQQCAQLEHDYGAALLNRERQLEQLAQQHQLNIERAQLNIEHAMGRAQVCAEELNQINLSLGQIVERLELNKKLYQEEKVTMEDARSKRDQQISNIKQLEQSQQTLAQNMHILTVAEVESISSRLHQLEQLVLLSLPSVSSGEIYRQMAQQEAAIKRETERAALQRECDVQLSGIPVQYREWSAVQVRQQLTQLEAYQAQELTRAASIARLEDQMTTLKSQMGQVVIQPDPTPLAIASQQVISHAQSAISYSERAHLVLHKSNELQKLYDTINAGVASLGALKTLRKMAENAKHEKLSETAESMNATINHVCRTMFTRHISVRLELYKEIKSTKQIKPDPNLKIMYKNAVRDGISQISVGEAVRTSLAFTIALNRISSCPFLLIDESIGSIDLPMQDSAIRTLRNNVAGAVIVIAHGMAEGIFDDTVDMDELLAEGKLISY